MENYKVKAIEINSSKEIEMEDVCIRKNLLGNSRASSLNERYCMYL